MLAHGHDPLEYSRCLLRIAETVIRSGMRVEALGMAMPGSYLGHRIRQILDDRPAPRLTRARMVSAMCACSLLSAVFAAAAVDRKSPNAAAVIAAPAPAPSQAIQPSVAASPAPRPPAAPVAKPAPGPVLVAQARSTPAPAQSPQNQRLLAFYVDLTQMTEDDLARAVAAAQRFVRERMQDQDRIALMTHGSNGAFRVVEDFTEDRDRLVQALQRLALPPANTGDASTPESRPVVIRRAIQVLAALPDKKALLLFTRGPGNSGSPEELQSAIDDAVHGKVAIYVIDTRGVVLPPR